MESAMEAGRMNAAPTPVPEEPSKQQQAPHTVIRIKKQMDTQATKLSDKASCLCLWALFMFCLLGLMLDRYISRQIDYRIAKVMVDVAYRLLNCSDDEKIWSL